MTVSSSATSFYLHAGPERVLAHFEPADPAARPGSAVLICPPWGWEETASYRVRRTWAQKLAADGHPTLRFDLPGTGDSTGGPAAAGRVERWVETVAVAAARAREQGGRGRVAAIGLGIGGLLALVAAGRGAEIEDFVLWGSPAAGRRFVRETEAFARMQAWGVGRGDESPLPDGWIDAGGFVLSAETIAELKGLVPEFDAPRRGCRALVLDRDGTGSDPKLTALLESAGFETTVEGGQGWGQMTVHPETARLPQAATARVGEWLDAAAPAAGDGGGATAASSVDADACLQGPEFAEEPLRLPGPHGSLFGVLAEPLGSPRAAICAVFLNAGAIRHIGPSRIWVENARRWAARGVPSLRVDLDGIGEADGEEIQAGGVAGYYSEVYRKQVVGVLDELEARGVADRFVLLGLCSGAFWSLQVAGDDPRVRAVVMLNAGALVWEDELQEVRRVSLLTKALRRRSSWGKLLRGEVNLWEKLKLAARLLPRRCLQLLRSVLSRAGAGGEALPTRRRQIAALLDRVAERDLPVAMAFCVNEHVLDELRREGLVGLSDWPNVEMSTLVGEDHALGPIGAQASAGEVIDGALEALLKDLSVAATTSG
ncbi:MAG: hypothetical protein JSS97_06655 [Actinobacteria bacterium]|nr:hypothetical protein [Actinomycetota bacterium]